MHKTKSSKTDSSTYSNSSAANSHPQLAYRPFASQPPKVSSAAKTSTDIEDVAFAEQQMEATGLSIQAKYGKITPEGQERLTVLQAKMDGLLNSRLSHATQFGHNIANIPLLRPQTPTPIQAKLTIGEPGDKYEQEADETARQVVQRIHQSQGEKVQRESLLSDEELQMKPERRIQRESLPFEEDELQMKPMVQRVADGGMATSPDLETSIQQARSGGQPLADNVSNPMERAFGADFSGVKVHADAQADQLNQSIQARAFTTGQDVFFRQGEYNPGSRGGQELIAHELTHVVQQNGAHLIQAKFNPAPTPKEPNRHFDDFLGSYIDQISDIAGYEPWKKFYQAAGESWWIYMPPTSYRKEKYVRYLMVDLSKLKSEEENSDAFIKWKLESGNWHDLTEIKKLSASDALLFLNNIKVGTEWKKFDSELSNRINVTFPLLRQGVENKTIELTPDLIKKVNEVIAPLQNINKPTPGEKEILKASQALAELDYAAKVSTQQLAAPFILGAQSRVRSPGQKDTKQESTYGNLPPLGVLNMEVDAYYLDSNGILHADEVKDTPNAFAQKVKDGGQVGRQIDWLEWNVLNPKTNQFYKKQVHYFVRAEGPKFNDVLSEAVIDNLAQLEPFQKGVDFIRIGDYSFTLEHLKGLYNNAISWLQTNNAALTKLKIKPSDAAKQFFGDVQTAKTTLKEGNLSVD
ncbi:MAG: DUF4157 domain-containing protein [Nostoc sp.]|uniref:eCIS core domain-containing protein n=1 Tax=Nostoc sp. TaxID=1180 RepID=UPI002FFA0C6F